MCNRHRWSRGFTIFIWLCDLEKWHKVTSHKDGVNAPVDIGGHIVCEGTELLTFSKRLKVKRTRLVNLMMGASLLATVLESERCIGRPRKPPVWCKHLGSICYRSRVIADFVPKNVNFSYPPLFNPKFGNLCVGVGGWHLASEERRSWANCRCNYFSEFSTYVITVQS